MKLITTHIIHYFFCFQLLLFSTASAASAALTVEEDDFGGGPPSYEGVSFLQEQYFSATKNRAELKDDDDEELELVDHVPSAQTLVESATKAGAKANTSSADETGDDDKSYYDVIIVGAGWSGLSAGLVLQAEDPDITFKILEARDYIGGRSYTQEVNGENLDMGSMWLLQGTCNPLYDHFDSLQSTSMRPYLDTFQLFDSSGDLMSDEALQNLMYDVYYGVFYYYLWSRQYFLWSRQYAAGYAIDEDEAYAVVINETHDMLADFPNNNYSARKEVMDTALQHLITIPYGADLEELSLIHGDGGSYLCSPDAQDEGTYGHFVQSGFSPIVDAFAEPIKDKIQTEAFVKVINYKKDNVKVVYEDLSSVGEGTASVTEKIIYAKKIIVTVPLGVLKRAFNNGGIKFHPPFPASYKRAIDGIGFGKQIRVFMFWDTEDDIFWPQSPDVFLDATSALESDLQIKYYNPTSLHNVTKPYIFAVLRSPEAFEIEKLYSNSDPTKYEEEIMKIAMSPLRRLFGDVPNPTVTTANKWNTDKFSYGTYSFNKVGHKPSMRKRLQIPIMDKLFLAGEATMSRWYGSVHGAYWSGNGAAYKVIDSLNQTYY